MPEHIQNNDYVNTRGINPKGQSENVPIAGNAALATEALVAGGKWSSGWMSTKMYAGAETTLYSDVDGSYVLSYSQDDTDAKTVSIPPVTIQYQSSGGTRKGQFPVSATYIKFDYTNGSTAQTKFMFKIDLLTQPAQSSAETLNAMGSDTRTAQWTKTRIETKTSDATNDYAPVYRTGNSLNVHVDNPGAATDVSALAKDATLTSGNAKVQVTNLPGTQNVTGTVSVGNLPATQSVSGTVNVGNLPFSAGSPLAIRYSNGTAFIDPTQMRALTSSDVVTIANFPSTQAVSGPLTDAQLRANPVSVVSTANKPSNGTSDLFTSTATAASFLPANPGRMGLIINGVSGTVYLRFGGTATTTVYTLRIVSGAYFEMPAPAFVGAISAIGTGTFTYTEMS